MKSSTFSNSDFDLGLGIDMSETTSPLQIQLQSLSTQLSKTQIRLAEVSSKYENVLNLMSHRERQQLSESELLRQSIDRLNERITKLEHFMWRLFGALALLVFFFPFIYQYVIKGM